DALEERVAEARFPAVEPVASLLQIARGKGAEANRPVQRDAGGSGRRAFRSARTSSHGRAALTSSSNVSRRLRSSASTSGVTGVFSPSTGRLGARAGRFITLSVCLAGARRKRRSGSTICQPDAVL